MGAIQLEESLLGGVQKSNCLMGIGLMEPAGSGFEAVVLPAWWRQLDEAIVGVTGVLDDSTGLVNALISVDGLYAGGFTAADFLSGHHDPILLWLWGPLPYWDPSG